MRESLKEQAVPYDPAAWESLEKKLDAHSAGGKGGKSRNGYLSGIGAVLLIGTLIGWYMLSDQHSRAINQPLLEPGQETDAENGANAHPFSGLPTGPALEIRETPADQPPLYYRPGLMQQERNRAKAAHASDFQTHPGWAITGILPATDSPHGSLSKQDRRVQAQTTATLPSAQKMGWMPLARREVYVPPVPAERDEIDTGSNYLEIAAKKAEKGAKQQTASFPLRLSIMVAPDYTGVAAGGTTKFGAGAGIQLEYMFHKSLSVITGAFYSTKNYRVDNSFSPYGRPWNQGYQPEYIDASCGVIDIPLNLRYYVYDRNRHALFLSAGASSYIMRQEDYRMTYAYKESTYSVRGENRHFMAVYNLSLGYAHRLSQHWSLQAEPFLKLPARGVGTGGAKLTSMGVFVHLTYEIPRQLP